MANNRKHDRWLTDEQVEAEISVLKQSPRVALARAEQKEKYRIKYRRRQYLYTLRALEKRGRELEAEGWIPGEDDEDPLED